MSRSISLFRLFAVTSWLVGAGAEATTYQMMPDRALADQAGTIAAVSVLEVMPAPIGGPVGTDYVVRFDVLLKGAPVESTAVVRVPGGVRADGIGLKIWGAPVFEKGERALLFLEEGADGVFRIVHLMLGAFHERQTFTGQKVAVRDLSQAHAIDAQGADRVRDFSAFSAWLGDRTNGIERSGDYFLPAGTTVIGGGFEKYALLTTQGEYVRWFRFDQGRNVEWYVFDGGQPGLGLDPTVEAFRVALRTWTDDPNTYIRYDYVGTTGSQAGVSELDGINSISFDDPHRGEPREVPGSFTCPEGGVIAFGGPWFYKTPRTWDGLPFHEAPEADIVTNDGTECLFRNNPVVAEEVFTHELGHTLGLAHSADRTAIMWASVHNDGRGADLKEDDLDGIAALYLQRGPVPTKPPAAPANLAVKATAPDRLVLTWRDRANNELGFLVEARIGSAPTFIEAGTVSANAKSIPENNMTPGETYAFRLRAYNRKGFSAYTKTVTIRMPN